MKHLVMAALVVAWIVLPACAQRSSARGGFSGNSAHASPGGPSARAADRHSRSRGQARGRSVSIRRRVKRTGIGTLGVRSAHTGSLRHRRPYVLPNRAAVLTAVSARMTPYFLAYPGAIGNDLSPAAQDSTAGRFDEQADAQERAVSPLSPSQPGPVSANIQSLSEAPDSEDAVTLIFKDGRPPEQIHNYILTRGTLYVGDRHHPDIPVDQLDVTATAKANQDAGADFRFPNANR
jgi:hypothetical protein